MALLIPQWVGFDPKVLFQLREDGETTNAKGSAI
jgi:hypothetical protein